MNDPWPLPGKRRALVILALSLSIALLLALGVGWSLVTPRVVIVRGEIEATEVDLAVSVAGHVRDKSVKIGDHVRRGDPLLTLVNPVLEAKLVQAMAASNIAEAEMQRLLVESRRDKPEQQLKTWKRAREISEETERNLNRTKQTQNSATLQPGQKSEPSQGDSGGRQGSARGAKKAAPDDRQEKRELAIARAAQAKAVVFELKKNLEELNVVSPLDGEVGQVYIDRDELANAGAVLISIIDLSEVWVTANLREDLLASLRMHESIKGKVPALGGEEVEFEITSVSLLEDYARDTAEKKSDTDLRIFKVRAVPKHRTEDLRPGMSVLFEVPSSASKS